MNLAQFKDPVCHKCLAAVVAYWSLTQEVTEWQVRALLLDGQIFCHSFRQNSIKPSDSRLPLKVTALHVICRE